MGEIIMGIVICALGMVLMVKVWWSLSFNFSSNINAAGYVALVIVCACVIWIGMVLIGFGARVEIEKPEWTAPTYVSADLKGMVVLCPKGYEYKPPNFIDYRDGSTWIDREADKWCGKVTRR